MRALVYLAIGVCAGLLWGFIIATGGNSSERMAGKVVQKEWDLLMEGRTIGKALVINENSYVAVKDVVALTDLEALQQGDQLFLLLSGEPFRLPKGIGLDDVKRKIEFVQKRIQILRAQGPAQTESLALLASKLQAELAVYDNWKTELELGETVDERGGANGADRNDSDRG
ncbi:hypothetical protein [Cohnella sp. JJ-181]|uniref:hypothetical protein n=1 Tax=Cohnella rhizoplanae TaxID=2974897 RepID=UPI0022FF5FEC|nr:hypothetical protein [Cohnella sp. JJ-181]CAI6051716.1 hypothetical protein COHCIP112018_01503 [Cohnella sp. JJ-181]